MLNRRDMIKGICAVAGASTTRYCSATATENKVSQLHGARQPKRVVFFLQSQGFSNDNCTVKGLKSGK